MPTKNYIKLISEAQKILAENPPDLGHEITHHYRVYENCFKIIDNEKLEVNKEFLSIVAWWHDLVSRGAKPIEYLQELMTNFGYSSKEINICTSLIEEHSYGKKQTTLESQILFDADKLEYVNFFRIYLFIEAGKLGLIDQKLTQKYYGQWLKRVPNVRDLLHFKYSKKKFDQWLPKAKELMNKV